MDDETAARQRRRRLRLAQRRVRRAAVKELVDRHAAEYVSLLEKQRRAYGLSGEMEGQQSLDGESHDPA